MRSDLPAAGSRSGTCRASGSRPGRPYRSKERTEAWRSGPTGVCFFSKTLGAAQGSRARPVSLGHTRPGFGVPPGALRSVRRRGPRIRRRSGGDAAGRCRTARHSLGCPAALEAYGVPRWVGWYRQITLAVLAHAFLAVTAHKVRGREFRPMRWPRSSGSPWRRFGDSRQLVVPGLPSRPGPTSLFELVELAPTTPSRPTLPHDRGPSVQDGPRSHCSPPHSSRPAKPAGQKLS